MKKTKINFEDINAGDLLEIVSKQLGIKSTISGIAFEEIESSQGEKLWQTSEGGLLVADWDEDPIYRIDVREVQFDDIKKGDKLKVTTETGNVTTIIEGVAAARVHESVNPYWVDGEGHILIFKNTYTDSVQTVEILEAGK